MKAIATDFPQASVPTPAIGRYAQYLKKVYIRSKLPVKNKWPPTPSKKIIKLAAVEKKEGGASKAERAEFVRALSVDEMIEKKELVPLQLEDILNTQNSSTPKCVLVEGVPGIGKSTFAWKACRKWAKGKLFREYDLVVLLQMRDKKVKEAKNLVDLFYHSDARLSSEVAQEISDGEGKGVLLIFEAIDELPSAIDMLNKDNDSLLTDLIRGIQLPEATLIITSRPWAIKTLVETCKEQISRQVEILGFTREDISRYITTAFCDAKQCAEFEEYISLHPHMQTIMYIPLNAAIMIQVYKSYKYSDNPLPQTMTQLYSALVRVLILRYMKNHPRSKQASIKLENLSELPLPIRDQFHRVCELAYTGLTKPQVQVVFPESELPRKFESLGLMQSATELSTDTGMSVSINFLHITIQEFLAAYHLSLQPHQEQLKFLRECSQLPRFANVVGFLCGLTQFSSSVWQCLHSLITSYNSRGDLLILDRQGLNLLHWLHEVQAPHTFLKTNCIRFCPNYMTQLSPLDFHVLGYCISHSNCSWHLDISRANFDSTSVKMICNSCTLVGSNSAGATGRISVLKAYSLDCCHQVLCSISELPHTILQGLETIDLGDNNFMSLDRLATVLETICLPHLETLNLGNTSVGNGGAVALLRALRTSSSTISNLCLSGSGIGHNDAEELRELLVASHTLSCLDINANPFSSESLQLISIGLAISTSLASLDLSYIKFDQPAIEHLSAALGVNHTLRKLNLTCCGIDNDGAYNLAEVLEGNKALEVLFINRNEVGEDGARAFAEMLKKNQSLKKLSLADESIRFGGVFTLIAALEHNDTLEMLFLHNKCNPPELTLNYRSSFCEPDFVCFPDLFHELLVW